MKPKPKITLTRKQLKAFQTHLNRVCDVVYRLGLLDGECSSRLNPARGTLKLPVKARESLNKGIAKAIYDYEGWVQKNLV